MTGTPAAMRSEEHTSEPSHLVISYAVFCLKKKKKGVGRERGGRALRGRGARVRGARRSRQLEARLTALERLEQANAATGFEDVFFFNNRATAEIYTLSLPDALPI